MRIITKPMHRRIPIITALVAAFAVTAGCGGGNHSANPSGTLEAVVTDISPTIPGRVVEVQVEEGDRVEKGDTLVILDTDLTRLQREQSATGLAAVKAKAAVAENKQAQVELSLELAERTLSRLQALAEEGSATRQQLDEAENKRDLAALRIQEVRHNIEVLHAERTKLRAALKVYDRQLAEGILVAPGKGTILTRLVEPGEVVTPGAIALRLADLGRLELKVYLAATELERVKLGSRMPVMIDALEGERLTGKVSWISSEAEFTPKNAQTRDARTQLVYAVKLLVDNPDGRLHIGMPGELVLGPEK